jgi:hypothetical protein
MPTFDQAINWIQANYWQGFAWTGVIYFPAMVRTLAREMEAANVTNAHDVAAGNKPSKSPFALIIVGVGVLLVSSLLWPLALLIRASNFLWEGE